MSCQDAMSLEKEYAMLVSRIAELESRARKILMEKTKIADLEKECDDWKKKNADLLAK